MELGPPSFAGEGPHGSNGGYATQTHLAGLGGLDSESLSHDGATTSNGLQIGHAAATWRGMTSGSRKGA